MSLVGRFFGALLCETQGEYFLVGNPKEPGDFGGAGFEAPPEIDALSRPYLRLSVVGKVAIPPPVLRLSLEGEALPRLLAERFLIERNGSVSERLWRLVLDGKGADDVAGEDAPPVVEASWLAEIPATIWRLVREAVLRCT